MYAQKKQYSDLFGAKVSFAVKTGESPVDGYWVRGDFFSHLPGHELFEDYSDESVTLSLEHESGANVLMKDQALHKFQALHADRKTETKKADDAFTSVGKAHGGAEQIFEMMQRLQGMCGTASPASTAVDAEKDAANSDTAEAHDDDNSSDSDVARAPTSLFARMRAGRGSATSVASGASTPAKSASNTRAAVASAGACCLIIK